MSIQGQATAESVAASMIQKLELLISRAKGEEAKALLVEARGHAQAIKDAAESGWY